MIDILVATSSDKTPNGLEYIPDRGDLIVNKSAGWAKAANQLLDSSMNDVLFIDDDISLTPHTFDLFNLYKDKADIIGFTLVNQPSGSLHSAGWTLENRSYRPLKGQQKYHIREIGRNLKLVKRETNNMQAIIKPGYVAHITASCMFVKKEVLASGLRFPEWDEGLYWEDVAFTLNAWICGFKVACIPGLVFHPEVGYKTLLPGYAGRRELNRKRLIRWAEENDIEGCCLRQIIPLGTWDFGII